MNASQRVIVWVNRDPASCVDLVQGLGGHVVQVLELIPALVVEAPEEVIASLTRQPWVERVEPDVPVQAL